MYQAHLQFPPSQEGILQELQSLIGLLNFACSVVLPGRAFPRRLIDRTIGITTAHHIIRLLGEAKEDLRVWLTFLSSFNGRSFFLDDIWHSSISLIYSLLQQVRLVLGPFLKITGAMGNGLWIGYIRILLFLNFIQLF